MSTNTRSAVVLGASGSVGGALLAELFRAGSFSTVVVVVRTSAPARVDLARAAGIDLREVIVPTMDPPRLAAATTAAVAALAGDVVGLSVLGVGAGTQQLTIGQHRAVDVALNAAFAQGLQASGKVRHIALMTAAGADPTASETGSGAAGFARYNRVKGEAEEAVKASGLPVVSIFRPAMILGSQHTPRLLEKVLPLFSFLTPARYKSIHATQIAKAMVAQVQDPGATSAVLHYPEMIALNR